MENKRTTQDTRSIMVYLAMNNIMKVAESGGNIYEATIKEMERMSIQD